ncbi:nucleoside diphosphate kinase 6-like [Daphnia pulicaria]|uniref:nucleoside diphosphate kinase 6-like n=1 Tax=Daphnia pulicaria TaxID=35523 RepID=UPI001EEBC7AA|nr:nucleoside diphosphate kinase 6-like [Daphnia pulicaria]
MKNILQLTLAILKPDVVKVPFVVQEIRHTILTAGFYVVQSRSVNLSHQEVEHFYSEHAGRFFHQRLVTFMKSGPIHVHILAHPEAIQLWRQTMGPTKSFITQFEAPETIRGSFGLTDTRNCTHGSDSLASALKEITFFFPKFNYEEWSEKHEPLLRRGECIIDNSTFTHKIK